MAAFFISYTPRAACRRAPVLATPRTHQLRTVHLAAAAARGGAAAAGEILFFLWTLGVVAFSFLVMAGFLE